MMDSEVGVVVNHRGRLPLLAAGVSFAVAASMAAIKLIMSRGFGKSDIFPFLVWTLPLSVLIGIAKKKLVLLLRPYSPVIKYCVMIGLGAIAGILWTYVVGFFLGPWIGAFSFSILACWIAAGASGMIVGATGTIRANELLLTIAVGTAVLLGHGPVERVLSNSQQIEVVGVKWTFGPEPLSNPSVLGTVLSPQDMEQLKTIGLTGKVEIASSAMFGKGKHRRAIIVIRQPLSAPVTLPEVDADEVIYVQTRQGWKTYPSTSPILERTINLIPAESATHYTVEIADGMRKEGVLAVW